MKQLEYMRERAHLFDKVGDGLVEGSDLLVLRDLEAARWNTRFKALEAKGDPLASFITGTNVETIYNSTAAGTAKNTFTSEVLINDTAGMGALGKIPAAIYGESKARALGVGVRIVARGILSSTGTPTYTFSTRGGTAANTTAAIMLGSAALTTGSGVSNQMWEFEGDIALEALGAAGANSTIRGIGMICCGGLASPFTYPVWGGAASPGTVATFDASIDNFINFNVTCSASSASNTITIQQLWLYGLN